MEQSYKITESRKKHRCHKQKRHDHSHRGDRKSLIIFTVFACLTLSLCFHYIKICQTDHACQTIERKYNNAVKLAHAKFVSKDDRKNSETDNITQRIYLNAKGFLVVCPVFLCSRYFSVKHITQSGECQTENCHRKFPIDCTEHTHYRRNKTDICNHYRIIIKSYHS